METENKDLARIKKILQETKKLDEELDRLTKEITDSLAEELHVLPNIWTTRARKQHGPLRSNIVLSVQSILCGKNLADEGLIEIRKNERTKPEKIIEKINPILEKIGLTSKKSERFEGIVIEEIKTEEIKTQPQ